MQRNMLDAAPMASRLVVPGAAASAVLLGVLAGTRPTLAVAAAAGTLIMALPFIAPATFVTLVVLVGALVPVDVQNRFGLGVGAGASGLLLLDLLIVAGLSWAVLAIVTRPIDRRTMSVLALTALFLFLSVVQLAHGLSLGYSPSDAGADMRNLLGLVTLILVLPLAMDGEGGRRRLYVGLIVAGLVLGVWGNAQWILGIGNDFSEEIGITEGVAQTTSGAGKLMGGRYAFPAAVILAFAALASRQPRPRSATVALIGILVLNSVALLLTFERAFWLATVFAILLVIMRSGHLQRVRALVWGGIAVVLVAAAASVVAPGQFVAARERLLSVGQYQTDLSVQYRVRESGFVIREIREATVAGSGLGASIFWGRPAEGVPPSATTYAHNAYLWLAWKLGVPGALLLLSLVASVLFIGARRRSMGEAHGTRNGALGGLLAMLIVGVTAPVFSTVGASTVIGVLLALAIAPMKPDAEPSRARAPV
ncbi:MAG TPA: O-antigen ligase family protein [Solirubrobacteraceae bacterium]|nr:O-antigen ligase family protein [Solirubrobacteraceae bacterium]